MKRMPGRKLTNSSFNTQKLKKVFVVVVCCAAILINIGLLIACDDGLIVDINDSVWVQEIDAESEPELGYLEDSYGIYVGELIGNFKHGQGTFSFDFGARYKGNWTNNVIDGQGEFIYGEYGKYTGENSEGLRSGKGEFVWADGTIYTGRWLNDAMEGAGKITYKDGSVLEGEFFNNKIKLCDYSSINNNCSYRMTISDSAITYIAVTFNNGTEIAGSVSNDQLNGQGYCIYANGDNYNGNYSNGARSGQGIYIWKNGATYSGLWASDKMQGTGVYTYSDGATKISGKFIDNRPDGTCKYTDANGNTFDAVFANGKCTKVTLR